MEAVTYTPIDQVLKATSNPSLPTDVVELEWFEVNRVRIRRNTRRGVGLMLHQVNKEKWEQGDVLCSNGVAVAVLYIKPCLVIVLQTDALRVLSDFCYYVGNRHLPIFKGTEPNEFVVPYDGNLYEQLNPKFQNYITLREMQLLEVNRLGRSKSSK